MVILRYVLVTFCALLPAVARPQALQATAKAHNIPDAGSVSGRVVCGDTQRPARVAQVRLVPIPSETAGAKAAGEGGDGRTSEAVYGGAINATESDIDGSFSVGHLSPGRYFVRVDLAGYVVPLLLFTPKELQQPDDAVRQRMARELEIVDVRPHAETRVEVTLRRGASVTGTIQYDDGSPAIGLSMHLLTPGTDGALVQAQAAAEEFSAVGSDGRYSFAGIPPGTYAVQVNLSLNEHTSSSMAMPTGEMVEVNMTKSVFELPVYSGDKLRKQTAVLFKVEGAGEDGGHDVVIPLGKLHHVAGQVLAPDGHPLNGGKVVLRYPDDGSTAASVEIDRTTRQFRFPYVPEGSFKLSVEDARELTEVQVPNPTGVMPRTHLEEKVSRRFGTAEQPLVVQNEMEGVLATVPDASAGAKTGVPPAE